MISNSIKTKIDSTIKDIWQNSIRKDYENDHLLKEDTLKNCFYYHLRRKLGTKFLEDNNIRIFTEFNDSALKGSGFRADIAIVEMGKEDYTYLGDNVKSIIAIIELKYKNSTCNYDVFFMDIEKVKNYIKSYHIDCQYYLGFIHEKEHEKETHWLDDRQTKNWASKKVTVLYANREIAGAGDLVFKVDSYNGLK